MEKYYVEMKDITKSFGGVHALKNVSFKIVSGRVNVLIGENGAGKSTPGRIMRMKGRYGLMEGKSGYLIRRPHWSRESLWYTKN